MKKLLTLIVLSLLIASPAGATTYRQTLSPNGTLEVTKPFQPFGNFQTGDCQYEIDANLILFHWPKSTITTAEVENAYNTNGAAFNSDGLWEGQDFLISTGFAGHHARSVTEATNRGQIVYAANHGGVLVDNLGPVRMHTFAIIRANTKQLTVLDDGYIDRYNWPQFIYDYTQQGETLTYYAVKW